MTGAGFGLIVTFTDAVFEHEPCDGGVVSVTAIVPVGTSYQRTVTVGFVLDP